MAACLSNGINENLSCTVTRFIEEVFRSEVSQRWRICLTYFFICRIVFPSLFPPASTAQLFWFNIRPSTYMCMVAINRQILAYGVNCLWMMGVTTYVH